MSNKTKRGIPKMTIAKRLRRETEIITQAEILWELYQSRRLQTSLEPQWILPGFDAIAKILQSNRIMVSQEDVDEAQRVIGSYSLDDGTLVPVLPGAPEFGQRAIDDGFKVGTPSWICMGRNNCVPKKVDDNHVLISRSYGKRNPWYIAYHLTEQMGTSALSSNCYGPLSDPEEVVALIKEYESKEC